MLYTYSVSAGSINIRGVKYENELLQAFVVSNKRSWRDVKKKGIPLRILDGQHIYCSFITWVS